MAQRLLREGGRGHPHQDDLRLLTRNHPRCSPMRLSSFSRCLQTTKIKGYPWVFDQRMPGDAQVYSGVPLSGLRFTATQRHLEIPSSTGAS